MEYHTCSYRNHRTNETENILRWLHCYMICGCHIAIFYVVITLTFSVGAIWPNALTYVVDILL